MMTLENTTGYTQGDLNILNEEFNCRFENGEFPTDDRTEAEQWFADEVARRTAIQKAEEATP